VLNTATKTCVACPANCYNGTQSQSSGVQPYCYWSSAASASMCTRCNANFTLVQSDFTNTGNTYGGPNTQGGASCLALPGNCSMGVAATATATVGTCN